MPQQTSLVISYARVSSGKQRREGAGLRRQIDMAAEWAAERGLVLDDRSTFADDGASGSKGEHLKQGAALHGILEAASKGQLGASPTLLIEDASRLSRLEPLDGLERVFLPLVRSGVRICLMDDGSEYDADTLNKDQGSLLMLVLKIQAAAAYARKLKDYGLAHRAKNRQQILDGQPVCPGWAPSWIDRGPDGWQLNNYAPTVARLLELLLECGTQLTASTLNREGHLSPQGKPWTQGGVLRLLENPAVYGARRIADPDHASKVLAWRKELAAWELTGEEEGKPPKPKRTYQQVEGTYPALISRQEYDRLKAVIAKRSTAPRERGRRDQIRYIGQMLTHCVCGARIGVRHTKDPSGARYSYLFCSGRQRGISNCRRPAIRLEPVTAHLLTRLRKEHLAALVGQSAATSESKAQALLGTQAILQATLAEQQQQLANARDALKERAKSGRRNLDLYEESVDEAAQAVDATQKQLSGVLADLASLRDDGLSSRLDEAVRELLRGFARGETTVEQRRAVNKLLHRMEAQITLDTTAEQVGLAVAGGVVDWKPLAPIARSHALANALVDPVVALDRPDARPLVLSADGRHIVGDEKPEDPALLEVFREGQRQAIEQLRALYPQLSAEDESELRKLLEN